MLLEVHVGMLIAVSLPVAGMFMAVSVPVTGCVGRSVDGCVCQLQEVYV